MIQDEGQRREIEQNPDAHRAVQLSNDEPPTHPAADSGLFARRTFYLLPHDRPNRPDDPECPYRVGSPLEAVDPRTVAAGKAGSKTPRSQATGEILPARS